MLGRTLGHYKVLEKLGRGGMGQVFAAEDTKLSRKVALKLLPEEVAASAARLSRFEREAKAVAAFNHPNIVTIHSVEEAEGLHFIVMELVRGKRLSELIPARGMPLARFLEIAVPVAGAVSAAHQQGINAPRPEARQHHGDGRASGEDPRFWSGETPPRASIAG